MKSKQYRLSIKNNKIILKEDVSQTITSAQFGNLVKNTIGSTFKFLKTTAESMANLFIFSIGSILTMFASEDVKQRILNRYENRKKEIFKNYDNILKDLELESGHEAASFLFSPSLYVYEKITKDIDNKGILSDNLIELIDDPYQYAMTAIPKIKTAFVGTDPTTKKEVESLYKDYRDINKQSKLYEQIKKLGVGNLEKMLNDRSLDREQKISIKNLIEYLRKNESTKTYKTTSLKIGKNLILEEENQNTKEILNLIDSYKEEISNNLKTIAKEISEMDSLERKFGLDQKEFNETIKEYIDNNVEVLDYYEEISKFIFTFIDYLNVVRNSIESKNLNEMISFGKTILANAKSAKVKAEFKKDYEEGIEGISNFIKNFEEIASKNNRDDSIKVLKLLVRTFISSDKIQKLKVEIVNTKTKLSENGVIYENYEEFFNNIESLSEKQVVSEKQRTAASNGKEKIKETAKSFDNLLTRLDEVIQYLKSIKVDKDSNETE